MEFTDQGIRKEAEAATLQMEVANALRLEPSAVMFQNAEDFIKEGSRFLKGLTNASGETPVGFFKLSKDEDGKRNLQREGQGTLIAQKLGIPTTDVLNAYTQTETQKGIIHLKALDSANGTFIPAELVSKRDASYGKRAAETIAQAYGKEIPEEIDTSKLNEGDWRNKSLETFGVVWQEGMVVLDDRFQEERDQLIPKDRLTTILDETKQMIDAQIQSYQTPEKKYFVHNDLAPNNMFFENPQEGNVGRTILLDFEHAGTSQNKFLAQLTDTSNFYSRCWANPAMQQEFLKAFLQAETGETLDYKLKLLKATIVFGTIALAKYGMDPAHPEHAMSVSLLKNLDPNLKLLDEEYNSLTNQNQPHPQHPIS